MMPSTLRLGILLGCAALTTPALAQEGPAHAYVHLPPDTLGLACAPTVITGAPTSTLRITGGQDAGNRRIWSQGDLITINAGGSQVEVGQEFYVRRPQVARGGRIRANRLTTIRTVGWVKVYAVEEAMSLVTVVHGCDTFEIGDYLEPFELPTVPPTSTVRSKPERDHYAQVLLGTDRRTSSGERDYIVIDQGREQGITPGMNLVLYRNTKRPDNFLFELGEAVAVAVRDTTATVLITMSRDAIEEGDLVAMRK